MRTEKLLWWLAASCAVLLLFAPFTPRTIWLPTGRSPGGGQITEGVGWQAISALFEGVALVALVLSFRARQRGPARRVGAAVATIAFVIIAVGMWRHWIDLIALIAGVGAGFAVVLTMRRGWRPVSGSR
jgi:hypothetical protein